MMENEQFDTVPNAIGMMRMDIKKVFTILGLGLSLSIILLNVVQFIAVDFFRDFFPRIYESEIFLFAISTIPLTIIAMPVLFAVTSLIPSTKTRYQSKISFKNLAKIFVISYVGMMFLNMVTLTLNTVISTITGIVPTNPLEEIIGGSSIWTTLLFAVILSPIVEEIMFRHIIINKLRGYGSGVAIFTSAFAFGLYHGNLFQMLYAFGLGLVFAAIVYKTGRLRYAIILHIAINFVGTVLPLGIASQQPIIIAICIIGVLGVLLTGFILGIITLCKTDFSRIKQDFMPREYIKPFFLNIGMIVYILLTLAIVVTVFIQ